MFFSVNFELLSLAQYRDDSIRILQEQGLSNTAAVLVQTAIAIIGILVVAWLVDRIITFAMRRIIPAVIGYTSNPWDDIFMKNKVFARFAHFMPGLVVLATYNLIAADPVRWFIKSIISTYFIVVFMIFSNAFLNSVYELIHRHREGKMSALKIYIQLAKVVLFSLGAIGVVSIFANRNFMDILAGLGAMITILLIVYKDMIMGFVAGIQLSANKMVSVGDWIEMPKDNADGIVVDIGLTTVKVQNWDRTITTIPTYKLTSESFTNWKGMQESDGRRIKRHVNIDMESIHFLSSEEIEEYRKIKLIREYIDEKIDEISKINAGETEFHNQRRLTNIGTFRKYVENYLRKSDLVNLDMMFVVRQLQSNGRGIPIEIYMFCKSKEFAVYERIQSDIFDHIFAIIPAFGLRLFQEPSGHNFNNRN
ncbi:MAG: mechanosensitive ion channel [Capnocytophaga sp.]|nr:mechanosensitive ion channel [Capnocytophaga sp.]